MKTRILVLMACATFLAPITGFCMEPEEDVSPISPMQRVLDNPELSIKILSFLALPKGLSLRVVSNQEDLDQIQYGDLGYFRKDRKQLFCKVYGKKAIELVDSKSHLHDNKIKIPSFLFDNLLNTRSFQMAHEAYRNSVKKSLFEVKEFRIYSQTDLVNIESVSKYYCACSRYLINSITTPSWATDDELLQYTSWTPRLKTLTTISNKTEPFPERLGAYQYVRGEITDKSVKTLTSLTELNLQHSQVGDSSLEKLTNLTTLKLEDCNVTENGIQNLTNLICLDLESFWKMTDNWLIDESGQPRHPKLKKLLLPNDQDHNITKDGVDIHENEYSLPEMPGMDG